MPAPIFKIGLNMAGAISAGAYTAGVMDFLIDALDAWYAKRQQQHDVHGDTLGAWEIPAHGVSIPVLSGASAGGMTAAITTAALYQPFQPVRTQGGAAANKLFQSWVADIDFSDLLSDSDLRNAKKPFVVSSILNSSKLDQIANSAVSLPLAIQRREYVADPLKVILTLTNVRGIPYTLEKNPQESETETRAFYYADQRDFLVSPTGVAEGI